MSYELVLVGVVLIALLLIIWRFKRNKKLPISVINKFSAKISGTKKLDPAHAIMESHKLFVAAIGTLLSDKKLTAAQKIARVQKRFPNHKQIWRHHKLRNRIAHETDVKVLSTQSDLARKDFIRALKSLG